MSRTSQTQRLRDLFIFKANEKISLKVILGMGIAQYNARIFELRNDKVNPMDIENGGKWVDGVHHTWFRYNKDKEFQMKLSLSKNNKYGYGV